MNKPLSRKFMFFLRFAVFLFIFSLFLSLDVFASDFNDINNISNINLEYNIIVKENGDSLVVITINGSGLVNVPLPLDANPVVKGAIYIPAENGIDIQLGELPVAIAYKTSLYTAKKEEWIFNAKLSDKTTTAVVTMPQNIEVLDTDPKAGISTGKTLQVKFPATKEVSIIYRFSDEAGKYYNIYKILFFVLLAIAVILTIVFILIGRKKNSKKGIEAREIKGTKEEKEERERREKKESGQHHIIKTLTRNESIIVKALQETNGEMKRNELERKTQLSKSSLAAALNTLERKNIIKIDKTQTVHYVEFTEWFRGL